MPLPKFVPSTTGDLAERLAAVEGFLELVSQQEAVTAASAGPATGLGPVVKNPDLVNFVMVKNPDLVNFVMDKFFFHETDAANADAATAAAAAAKAANSAPASAGATTATGSVHGTGT